MPQRLSEQDKIKMCLNCQKERCDDCLSHRGVSKRNIRSSNELIQIASMYASGVPVREIEQKFEVKHGSIYCFIKKGMKEIALSRGV